MKIGLIRDENLEIWVLGFREPGGKPQRCGFRDYLRAQINGTRVAFRTRQIAETVRSLGRPI